MIRIDIAKDFSITPGGRAIIEGPYSGEEFLSSILYPKYIESLNTGDTLVVNFDGCYGFEDCFLEEAFGGLVRMTNTPILEPINRMISIPELNKMVFISKEEPDLLNKVERFMIEAATTR